MDRLEAQPGSLVDFTVEVTEHTAVVTITGELDLSGIEPLAARVGEALAGGVTRLIVDVAGVRFADSSAIALWVRWASSVSAFELREPPALLRRVISAMGLSEKLGCPA